MISNKELDSITSEWVSKNLSTPHSIAVKRGLSQLRDGLELLNAMRFGGSDLDNAKQSLDNMIRGVIT